MPIEHAIQEEIPIKVSALETTVTGVPASSDAPFAMNEK
jgi:hypothetical protein